MVVVRRAPPDVYSVTQPTARVQKPRYCSSVFSIGLPIVNLITAQDPTISSKRPQISHPHSPLRSTPQAKGSATISEHISTVGVQVSDIRPWIMRDVEKFAQCPIDEMLKDLLVGCTVKSRESFNETHKTLLFNQCLDVTLPICNGNASTQMRDMMGKSSKVKEDLTAYTRSRVEADLYPLFVRAANTALLFLQDINIDTIRPATHPICFHVHDTVFLTQSHQGQVSQRKPDVVVVSDTNARDVHGSVQGIYTQRDLFLRCATEAPLKSFGWRSVRTFVEFKKSKNKMQLPPKSYSSLQDAPRQEDEYLTMDILSEIEDPDALPAGPGPRDSNPRPPPPPPIRRSARQQAKAATTSSSNRKRTAEQIDLSEPRSKHQKSIHTKGHSVIVQAGYYAAEMFAAHIARSHVIGLVIVDDILYLWRYDRQNAIQCSGFNFIQDLPRFLVLLLVMQRFENQHWGLNPYIDPKFGPRPKSHDSTLSGEDGEKIDVSLELSDEERVSHFGLNGRATNVLSVKSKNLSTEEDDLVVKVFWAEVARMGEPDILRKVHDIARDNAEVEGHVPEMLWHKIFADTSTANIRERLGLETKGARVLYMIIFRKLRPITELYGEDFLRAWWATVMCHLALWKNGVHHRDISPSNLLYRIDEGKIVGVLNDFDLASTQETATGTERTGTVPFMAVALLQDEALQGHIRHAYEHDAESFIWVLAWICLRYDCGRPRESKRGRPLDEWLRADVVQCRKEKNDFLLTSAWTLEAGKGHEENWKLAKECIEPLARQAILVLAARRKGEPLPSMDVDTAFETFLKGPLGSYLPKS